MVHDAESSGLVRTTPNPAHRRSSLIELTPQGRRVIVAVTTRERAVLREVGGLTGADVDACLRVLRQMLALFDDVDLD